MKINQRTAISTTKALLVPYEKHHVAQYHSWMQDSAIREATASEPLSLQEEHENQQSWRTAPDKLTFIICDALPSPLSSSSATPSITAHEHDTTNLMVGDVNLFLHPDPDDPPPHPSSSSTAPTLIAEVDVMVAAIERRRRGQGEAAVRALLLYLEAHLDDTLREYSGSEQQPRLRALMAKIKEGNGPSRALFAKLGFRQVGGADYFGEVTMTLDWEGGEGLAGRDEAWAVAGRDYWELEYRMADDG